MALEISCNSEFGYIFEKAYAKIENIKINVERDECWVDVRIYANQEARNLSVDENMGLRVMGIGKKSIKLKISELDIKEFSIDNLKTLCYTKIKEDFFKEGKDV